MFDSAAPSHERIVDSMIELARATTMHRIIVAGPCSVPLLGDLHRRGYARSTTVKAARNSRGQHDVALVAWHGPPSRALEATLVQLVPFGCRRRAGRPGRIRRSAAQSAAQDDAGAARISHRGGHGLRQWYRGCGEKTRFPSSRRGGMRRQR